MDDVKAVVNPAYEAVLKTVVQTVQHREQRVYPHQLVGFLPFDCCERTVRRYLVVMSQMGMIERISYRGGYRLAA